MNIIDIADRRAFRVREAAAYSGIGRTKIFALMKDGRLDSVKVGGSRLVIKASLDRLLTNADRPMAA